MNIDEWQKKAKAFVSFGYPSEEEWAEITKALLYASENGDTPLLDAHIDPNAVHEDREDCEDWLVDPEMGAH